MSRKKKLLLRTSERERESALPALPSRAGVMPFTRAGDDPKYNQIERSAVISRLLPLTFCFLSR